MIVEVLGVPIASWTPEELIEQMLQWAKPGAEQRRTILYANVHVLNTAATDRGLHAALCRASTVYCDGSGVRLGASVLGHSLPPRLTAADWLDRFWRRVSADEIAVYVVAGADGVANRAISIATAEHPALRVVGVHHGYLDSTSSAAVIEEVNRSGARILIVGMGTPTQELWISKYREQLTTPVVWAVGGLFDFVVGMQRRPPGWLNRYHMEWLGRLLSDPRRLASRYLIGNPLFCYRLVLQRLGFRSSDRSTSVGPG